MKQNDSLCSITAALYPFYLEHLTSPASNEFLEAHIGECPHCRKSLRIPRNASGCPTIAAMPPTAANASAIHPAADTAANLSEASYLRKCRRAFLATVSGVFLGVLLFALLLANMIYGAGHMFKTAANQKTVRTTSTASYRKWDSYQGISDFSIFPKDLSGCKTVNDYYYQCNSGPFFTELQLYLDCSYTPENYGMEKARLRATAQADGGQPLFAQPACYTMLFYDSACEYAVFLEEEQRILYISLQNAARDEVVFDEKYLPLDYGNFGSPPENQAKPYCIYEDAKR